MLALESVGRSFGPVVAVEDVGFEVPRGSVCGLIGPNGAGKTTTMRLILGICELERGRITWEGQPVDQVERRRLAYVPEERGLYPRMRLEDQLRLFGELGGRSRREAERTADRWIDRLGLDEYRRRPGSDLSKGNARKAQVAVALLNEPELVILDEPFEGLDPVNVRVVWEVLSERTTAGVTFLLSSHTMDFVEGLCDRVVLINRGRTTVAGALGEVRRQSARRVLRVGFQEASEQAFSRFERATGLGPGRADRDGARLYEVDREAASGDPAQRLLDAARAAGPVLLFSLGPPSLEEVYIELVGDGAA